MLKGIDGDQEMPVKKHRLENPVKGEVRRPFNQVEGRAAQRLCRVRSQQVFTMASRWEEKVTVEETRISEGVVRQWI